MLSRPDEWEAMGRSLQPSIAVQGVRFEFLESRICHSALLSGNVLTITGSTRANVISVSVNPQDNTKYLVKINRQHTSFLRSAIRFIRITGESRDDRITINDGSGIVKAKIGIWGGDGNDTLIGGSGNETIHGGTGDDLIMGGSGN